MLARGVMVRISMEAFNFPVALRAIGVALDHVQSEAFVWV